MIRALLINPYLTTNDNIRLKPVEPLGILYIASYVRREIAKLSLDIGIDILDAQLGGPDKPTKTKRGYRSGLESHEFEDIIGNMMPNIVGITNNYTCHTSDILQICKTVKKVRPDCILVIGGAHATIAHEELIRIKEIDIIVRREGEVTFWEILHSYYWNKSLNTIQGTTSKSNRDICINKDRALIEDLDSLPIPDRSLIPYEQYLSHKSYFLTRKNPAGTILSSRGCPFNCIFCSTQKVWSNKWRGRSPANILSEIEYLIKNYGVKEISFQDDQFLGSKDRIIELCRLIIRKNNNISLIAPPGMSPALIDDNLLSLMKDAGFYRINFSIDVGTKESKRFARKPINLDNMRTLIMNANSKGFWTYAMFVIGFPHETEHDIQEAIRYAYDLKLDYVRFYIAQPHRGSELYEIYLKDGLIKKNSVENYHSIYRSLIGTRHLSAEKLTILRNSAENRYLIFHLRHFLSPSYLINEFFHKIKTLAGLKYFLRLVLNFMNGHR
jgi:anaerobic magnesium-protoporphyrin IX monomethyl ester cyclase